MLSAPVTITDTRKLKKLRKQLKLFAKKKIFTKTYEFWLKTLFQSGAEQKLMPKISNIREVNSNLAHFDTSCKQLLFGSASDAKRVSPDH